MNAPRSRPAHVHAQRFSVTFDYPVVFCRGAFEPSDQTLAWAVSRTEPQRRHPLFVVIDSGVIEAQPELESRLAAYVEAHRDVLELVAPVLSIPGGEAAKNDPALVTALHARFAEARLDRHATVLVIGGGGVLDAVGYAASTTHRGLRVVRMPSTVLSQNDAGIGVKTGVNAFGAKNFIGTFAPPYAVVNDAALLRTLPLRDARAGLAEAVKVALIRDAEFFQWLEEQAPALARSETEPLELSIRRCAELHLRHIASAGDPFETGNARPLDYGHWAAHKLEILSDHELRHGEAVSIGMLLDARYAERTGLLPASDLARIQRLLEALGLPRFHPALLRHEGERLAVLRGLDEFREHIGGALCITLLRGIGTGVEVSEMDADLVAGAIHWLAEQAERACTSQS